MTPLILLARQRSGSSAFREALKAHGRYRCDGETFNPRRDGKDLNFWCFLESLNDPGAARPHKRATQFDAFLDHAARHVLADDEDLLIDVKYDQTNALDSHWNLGDRPPRLLARVIREGWPLIHLVRRNKLAQIVSFEKATATRQWNLREGKERAEARVWLTPETIAHRISVEAARDETMSAYLAAHGRRVRLYYEDVFTPGSDSIADEAIDAVEAILPGGRRFRRPVSTWLKKQARNYMDDLENRAAIEAALARSPHAWMLVDSAVRAG